MPRHRRPVGLRQDLACCAPSPISTRPPGDVFLDGEERREMPAHEWRRRVRYCAAEPALVDRHAARASRRRAPTRLDRLLSGARPRRRHCSIARSPSCRPASASASRSCARCSTSRACCCSTSRPARSIRSRRARRGADPLSDAGRAQRRCSSATTRRRVERLAHARLLLAQRGHARRHAAQSVRAS